jgi:hypothetical protein
VPGTMMSYTSYQVQTLSHHKTRLIVAPSAILTAGSPMEEEVAGDELDDSDMEDDMHISAMRTIPSSPQFVKLDQHNYTLIDLLCTYYEAHNNGKVQMQPSNKDTTISHLCLCSHWSMADRLPPL